jgi:pimeloyl-ACP methyl ester carboxylesterase
MTLGNGGMQVTEQRHTVGDIAVRLFRNGAGEPLVYLHGAGGFPGWLPFFEQLAAHYDVRAPEHPGFGTLDNAGSIRDVADMARYYLDFLDVIVSVLVNLVGNSLGGWIAAEVAVRNCSRIRTLSLMSPAGVRVKGVPTGDNFIWAPEEAVRNIYYDQSFADKILALTLSDEDADRQLANRFMAARLGWQPRWYNPALERWLHRISVPTLLLWGENDKLLPSAYAEVWKRRVPDIRVEIFPQCGHLPHVEQADRAAQAVLGFLEKARP